MLNGGANICFYKGCKKPHRSAAHKHCPLLVPTDPCNTWRTTKEEMLSWNDYYNVKKYKELFTLGEIVFKLLLNQHCHKVCMIFNESVYAVISERKKSPKSTFKVCAQSRLCFLSPLY